MNPTGTCDQPQICCWFSKHIVKFMTPHGPMRPLLYSNNRFQDLMLQKMMNQQVQNHKTKQIFF